MTRYPALFQRKDDSRRSSRSEDGKDKDKDKDRGQNGDGDKENEDKQEGGQGKTV